jgi:hypothetical protein
VWKLLISCVLALAASRDVALANAAGCAQTSNAFVLRWQCVPARNAVIGTAIARADVRVTRYADHLPIAIFIPALDKTVSVQYSNATLVRFINTRSGIMMVPMHSGVERYALVWDVDGEFLRFRGIIRMPLS